MTLSDVIEAHLRELLTYGPELEVQRNELSDKFACAPSHINYVLATRFTVERGYIVESRRGEGGYIRITRLACPPDVLSVLTELGDAISQREAEGIITRLAEAHAIPDEVAQMLLRVADRRVLGIGLPERDRLRQRLIKETLGAYFAAKGGVHRAV